MSVYSKKKLILILLLFSVLGCKSKKDVPTEKLIHSLETFNTGENNYVRSLAVEDNYLWVGTSGGVLKVDILSGNLIKVYNTDDGLRNNYVFTIGIDKNKVKWFGTNAGGLSRFDGVNWQTYLPLHGLADYWVYSIAFASDGMAWIGTWAGANKFDGKNFVTYTPDDGLINEWVYGVAIDKKGEIWFATEGGVSFFNGKTWKSWTNKDGLGIPNIQKLNPNSNSGLGTIDRHNISVLDASGKDTYNPNYVFCVLIDGEDRKWFGTWGGGVSRFDGREWKNFSTAEGLAGNIVYSMALDKKGVFWFGTNHGLSSYDGKNFRNYNRVDGLLDDHVYAVTVDAWNNKWIGQRGGVVRLFETEGKVTKKKAGEKAPTTEKGINLMGE